jgi:hypothetical protein
MTTAFRGRTKLISGVVYLRCYAYRHNTDADQFGLLEATCFADARHHLGRQFQIKAGWAPADVVCGHDKEERRRSVGVIFRKRVPMPDPTIGHDEDGCPIFAAVAESGPFLYPPGRDGKRISGCHLAFTCPTCGQKNYHGGVYQQKGAGDGHRSSHCRCWPDGYIIREVDKQ